MRMALKLPLKTDKLCMLGFFGAGLICIATTTLMLGLARHNLRNGWRRPIAGQASEAPLRDFAEWLHEQKVFD